MCFIRRATFLGLSLGVASICSAASLPGANAAILTEQSPQFAQVGIGVPVEFRLPYQPGTGFSWSPKSYAAMLAPLKPLRDQAIPGGWQTQRFRFVVKHAGTYRVTFSYDQPWHGGIKAARTKSFTIEVR